jgi:DNA-binding NarL/FixJ family response regulator
MSGLPNRPPNVLLMDIQLSGRDGRSAIRTLRSHLASTEIIMLSARADPVRAFAAFASGASGYLMKDTRPNEILAAIRDVHTGGSPLSAPIARCLVNYFGDDKPMRAFQPQVPEVEVNGHLTAREHQVMSLMAEGLLYKEAASRLGLSVETIRAHLRNIYKKLGARNRTEAILKLSEPTLVACGVSCQILTPERPWNAYGSA